MDYGNILSVLPHSGNMVFVDRIIEATNDSICVESVIKENNPFLEELGLPTYKTLEFLAQSLGVLKGLQNKKECSNLGFLLGVRNMEIYKPYLPIGAVLCIQSKVSMQDSYGSGIYDCELYHNGELVTKACLNVFNPKKEFVGQLRKTHG